MHRAKCPNPLYKERLAKSKLSSAKNESCWSSPKSPRQKGTSQSQQKGSDADYPAAVLAQPITTQHMFFAFLAGVTVVFPFLSFPPTPSTLTLILTGAINASSKYSQPYKDFTKLRFTSKLWATSCVLNGIQMRVFQSLYSIIIIKNISKSLKWVTAFPIPVLGSINNV